MKIVGTIIFLHTKAYLKTSKNIQKHTPTD